MVSVLAGIEFGGWQECRGPLLALRRTGQWSMLPMVWSGVRLRGLFAEMDQVGQCQTKSLEVSCKCMASPTD